MAMLTGVTGSIGISKGEGICSTVDGPSTSSVIVTHKQSASVGKVGSKGRLVAKLHNYFVRSRRSGNSRVPIVQGATRVCISIVLSYGITT